MSGIDGLACRMLAQDEAVRRLRHAALHGGPVDVIADQMARVIGRPAADLAALTLAQTGRRNYKRVSAAMKSASLLPAA